MSSTEPVTFAYRVPYVSRGLVVSTIEQRTDWGCDYNVELARLAEQNGFEYALSQVRFTAARSALAPLRLDRHWRNARTHTLHVPATWKVHHLGRCAVDGTLPPRPGQL